MANKNFVDNSNITSLITKIGQNFARLKSTMTRSQYENAQNLAPGVYPIEGDENELNVISTDMISDIEVTNPSNNDVLKYNSATQKWENGTGGSGSGGHTIQNDSGTALPQENALQFVGVYSEDDSTNGKTKVNIVREMTKAQMDALSTDAKKGLIRTTDEPDNPANINSFTRLQSGGQYIAIPTDAKEFIAYGKYSTSSEELYIGYFNVDVLDAQGSGTFWNVGRGYYYVYDSSVRHFTVTQYYNGQQSAEHMVIYWR